MRHDSYSMDALAHTLPHIATMVVAIDTFGMPISKILEGRRYTREQGDE